VRCGCGNRPIAAGQVEFFRRGAIEIAAAGLGGFVAIQENVEFKEELPCKTLC
jgi:hypothetical protein